MKTLKFLVLSLFLALFCTIQSNAQVDDTLPPWFNDPLRILNPRIIDWNSTFVFASPRTAILRSSTTSIAGKKINLAPLKARLIKTPLILKRGQDCYEFYCQRTKECNSCRMLWKDINGDRKVQPRRELRCVCASGGSYCSIKVRKVDCR